MAKVFSISTWRVLGLSVAAGYTTLGLFAFCLPHQAAFHYFAISPPTDGASEKDDESDNKVTSVSGAVSLLMPLLGARDLSIAAALWTLGYAGKWREFGVVIVAGTFLCVADGVAIWKFAGPQRGSAVTLGALGWTGVGLGLVLQRQ